MTSELAFIEYLKTEMDAAYEQLTAEITRQMHPIYSGPLTREDDAAYTIRLLILATGVDPWHDYDSVPWDEDEDEFDEGL